MGPGRPADVLAVLAAEYRLQGADLLVNRKTGIRLERRRQRDPKRCAEGA
jgi:hypothetical protein